MASFGYRKSLRRAAFGLVSVVILYNIHSSLNYASQITAIRAIELSAPVAQGYSPTFLYATERWGLVFTHLNESLTLNTSRATERGRLVSGPWMKNIMTTDSNIDAIVSRTSTQAEEGEKIGRYKDNSNQTNISVPFYSQKDMLRFLRNETDWDAEFHVLVFENGQFQLYKLFERLWGINSCKCRQHLMEVIVDGLLTARPHRFISTSQPWQVLLDINRDNVHYPCMDNNVDGKGCSSDDHPYPPVLTIESIPTNPKMLLPFVFQLPTVNYNECIYFMRRNKVRDAAQLCPLRVQVHEFANFSDQIWESLTPQIYWRATDLPFLPNMGVSYTECLDALPSPRRGNLTWTQIADLVFLKGQALTPRCHAVILSAKVEEEWRLASQNSTFEINSSDVGKRFVPWLNLKFGGRGRHHRFYGERGYGALVVNFTSASTMSRFKYQIDFGGAGGTTWMGTITKLAMPGLLFHHETPTKDFFHDELQPWVHYVPIHTNLSNLYDMFVWAETHPEEAKRIAQQGQLYAREHVSNHHFKTTFEKAFVKQLGPIADSYDPLPGEGGREPLSIVQGYKAMGFEISLVATCTSRKCRF